MNVNNFINEVFDYLGLVLFVVYIASGGKYDFILYTSILFFVFYFLKRGKKGWIDILYIFGLVSIIVLIPHYFGYIK